MSAGFPGRFLAGAGEGIRGRDLDIFAKKKVGFGGDVRGVLVRGGVRVNGG
jgi:hypothetical protein